MFWASTTAGLRVGARAGNRLTRSLRRTRPTYAYFAGSEMDTLLGDLASVSLEMVTGIVPGRV
jgi:hypothetical protein